MHCILNELFCFDVMTILEAGTFEIMRRMKCGVHIDFFVIIGARLLCISQLVDERQKVSDS